MMVKQMFFENKTIIKNTLKVDSKRRVACVQLERVMKEKGLIRVNG